MAHGDSVDNRLCFTDIIYILAVNVCKFNVYVTEVPKSQMPGCPVDKILFGGT
jgi:hypothetical protein